MPKVSGCSIECVCMWSLKQVDSTGFSILFFERNRIFTNPLDRRSESPYSAFLSAGGAEEGK